MEISTTSPTVRNDTIKTCMMIRRTRSKRLKHTCTSPSYYCQGAEQMDSELSAHDLETTCSLPGEKHRRSHRRHGNEMYLRKDVRITRSDMHENKPESAGVSILPSL